MMLSGGSDMKKVLVLGSSGMLGHQVFFRLKTLPDLEVFDVSARQMLTESTIKCDVTDFTSMKRLLIDLKPDVVINCVGVLIRGSHDSQKNAILINSYLPHWLAGELSSLGSKLIHVSTDCVFSGKKGGYIESDIRDADDVYGRTKALGEVDYGGHLTLRTSIIGPELKENGEGLLHWAFRQIETIQGYQEAFWGGVTTFELAKIISQILDKNLTGIIHVTNGQRISKYALLSKINQVFGLGLEISPVSGKHVDKSLISIRSDFDVQVPSYDNMLDDLHRWMKSKPELYFQYQNLFVNH
jgi:dTDP-4-dehydrorhamnose reductase